MANEQELINKVWRLADVLASATELVEDLKLASEERA